MRTRSLIAGVALFGAGAVVGAGATWFIMSEAASSNSGSGARSPPTTTSTPTAAEDGGGRTRTSMQRYGDQLRGILADLEVRLTDAVDDLVAHFSVSCTSDGGDETSKPSQKLSQRDDKRPSKSQCVLFLDLRVRR